MDGEFYLKINDAEYQAQAGQMFLLPYNSTQTYYHFSSHLATKYWVHFTAPCKDRDLLELISLPHFINVEDPQIVTNRFTEMLELNKSPHLGARLQQKAMLFQLLAYYIEHSNLPDAKDMFKDEKLAGLMLYIEEHLPDTLTINELCGYAFPPTISSGISKKRPAYPLWNISAICALSMPNGCSRRRRWPSRTSPRRWASNPRITLLGFSNEKPASRPPTIGWYPPRSPYIPIRKRDSSEPRKS